MWHISTLCPSSAFTRELGLALFMLCVLMTSHVACDDIPATNPYDPQTPGVQQAPGRVTGQLILPASFESERLGASYAFLRSASNPAEVAYEATPNSDGILLFESVIAGIYRVGFEVQGFGASAIDIIVPIGETIDLGEIPLTIGQTGFIEGVVYKKGAADGAHDAVRVGVLEAPSMTLSGHRGQFRLEVPIGTYTLQLSASGYVTESVPEVKVKTDEITPIDSIELSEVQGEISLVVQMTPDWIPEADRSVQVTLRGALHQETRLHQVTEENEGTLTFLNVPAGPYLIEVSRSGFDGGPLVSVEITAEERQVSPPDPIVMTLSDLVRARLNLSGARVDGCSLRAVDVVSGSDLFGVILTGRLGAREDDCEHSESLDLSDVDLSGADLTEADLTEASLQRANLTNANLEGVDLSKGHFTNARFNNARMAGSILIDADLTAADFVGAHLTGAIFTALDPPQPEGPWPTLGAIPDTLSRTPCGGSIEHRMRGAIFDRADLSGAVLAGADLRDVSLHAVHLTGADLRFSCLNQAELSRENLSNLWLDGADLSEALLDGATLQGTHMNGVNLNGATLVDAIIRHVQIGPLPESRCLDFSPLSVDCDVEEPSALCDCQPLLRDSNFDRASLLEVTIDRADMTGASLQGTRIAQHTEVAPVAPTRCQQEEFEACLGINDCLRDLIALASGTLSEAHFADWVEQCEVDPQYYTRPEAFGTLTFTDQAFAENTACLLQVHQTVGCADAVAVAQCFGPTPPEEVPFQAECDFDTISMSERPEEACAGPVHPPCLSTPSTFRDVSLRHARLEGLDVFGAEFMNTDFSHADLRSATLSDTLIDRCQFTQTDLAYISLNDSLLQGENLFEEANLEFADLRNINFSEAVITDANLSGVQLRGAVFDYSSSSNRRPPRTLEGAQMSNVYLSHLSWSGINMRDVDLSFSSLYDVDLSHSDLSYARLIGTQFIPRVSGEDGEINLVGADLSHTIIKGSTFVTLADDANFSHAHLEDLDLTTNFGGSSSFIGADFSNATLHNLRISDRAATRSVSFFEADLKDTLITDSSMRRANLRRADLRGARVLNTDLTDAILADSCLFDETSLGDQDPNDDSARFDGSILQNVSLEDLDLSKVSFVDADLSFASIINACNLDETRWTRAIVQGATFCDTSVLTGSSTIGAPIRRTCTGRGPLTCPLACVGED
jgi:uncharacterized protein YjbI with pentapeptide repeats